MLSYLSYGMMYLGRIPTIIYVRMWSHAMNNVGFLVIYLSREHGRLITKIKKVHPYRESYGLLPTFYTRTNICFANAIVSSITVGRPKNAWWDILLQSLWCHLSAVINIPPGSGNTNTTIETTDGEVIPVILSQSGSLLEADDGWITSGGPPALLCQSWGFSPV